MRRSGLIAGLLAVVALLLHGLADAAPKAGRFADAPLSLRGLR